MYNCKLITKLIKSNSIWMHTCFFILIFLFVKHTINFNSQVLNLLVTSLYFVFILFYYFFLAINIKKCSKKYDFKPLYVCLERNSLFTYKQYFLTLENNKYKILDSDIISSINNTAPSEFVELINKKYFIFRLS